MGKRSDIEFTIEGVEYSLTPMKQKIAAHVFHSCLSRVLAAIARAVTGETTVEKMASFATAIADGTDFEDIWFILENLMRHSMVDGKEVKSLADSGIFDENPHHMYLVIYHGVKGNWPGYFSKMEAKMSGFASTLKSTLSKMQVSTTTEGTED